MADNAPAAPAATPEASGTPELPKDVANAASSKAAPPTPKITRVKIKDLDMSEDDAYAELQRGRQSGKLLTEAEKRLQASAKKDKDFATKKAEARKDFKAALAALELPHEEAVGLMEKYLWETEIQPKQLSPEARRIKELEAQVAKTKAKEEDTAKADKQKAFDLEVKKNIQSLKTELEAVLNEKKIPGTRIALKRLAMYLKSYEEAGIKVPVGRAVDMLMGDYQQEFGELLDEASPDQLESFLGNERMQKLVKNVAKWALARKGKQAAPAPTEADPQSPTSAGKKKMTPGQFDKFIGGI